MDIFSPKDGFVVELIVAEGAPVKPGTHLLKMDTDDEDRDKERLAKMENVRLQMAAQYTGRELSLSKRLAEIAMEMAKYSVETLPGYIQNVKDWVEAGRLSPGDIFNAETEYSQAILNLEKAQIDLQKFEFAVARHLAINSIIKNYMAKESQYLELKRNRLTVLAPVSGKVKFQVAVNSFAELGGRLLTII